MSVKYPFHLFPSSFLVNHSIFIHFLSSNFSVENVAEEPMDVSEPVTSTKFTPTQFCSLVREDGALEVRELASAHWL